MNEESLTECTDGSVKLSRSVSASSGSGKWWLPSCTGYGDAQAASEAGVEVQYLSLWLSQLDWVWSWYLFVKEWVTPVYNIHLKQLVTLVMVEMKLDSCLESVSRDISLLLLSRFVAESFFWSSCWHLQLQLSGATQLLSQCHQVTSRCHCSATEPRLPESQVTKKLE